MKTLMMIGVAVVVLALVACPVFASSIIDEDENEIVARHEKRMEMIVRNTDQAKLIAKVDSKKYVTESKYDAVIKDLADFLGVKDKKIDIVGVKAMTNQEWADKYNNGQWVEMAFGAYRYLELTLEYKGETYTYGVVHYEVYEHGSYSATLDPALTGDEFRRVGIPPAPRGVPQIEVIEVYNSVHDPNAPTVDLAAMPSQKPPHPKYFPGPVNEGEIVSEDSVICISNDIEQRKSVEAEIELKGNGANYTVSGQMADAPEEVLPLQKKQ